jgi:hypothetical protein
MRFSESTRFFAHPSVITFTFSLFGFLVCNGAVFLLCFVGYFYPTFGATACLTVHDLGSSGHEILQGRRVVAPKVINKYSPILPAIATEHKPL